MTTEHIRQIGWAIITAAVADDWDGVHVLVDDLDDGQARDLLAGVAAATAAAISWHTNPNKVLELLREQLLNDQQEGPTP